MFSFGFHRRRPEPRQTSVSTVHVIARLVPAAPCGWIFFDGSETRMTAEDGAEVILPGGGFFPKEARHFASEAEASAEAARLNDAGLCLDRPWQAKAASLFQVDRAQVLAGTRMPIRA